MNKKPFLERKMLKIEYHFFKVVGLIFKAKYQKVHCYIHEKSNMIWARFKLKMKSLFTLDPYF